MDPGVDTLSGIDGYGIFETSIAFSRAVLDIGAVSSYTSPAWTSSTSPRLQHSLGRPLGELGHGPRVHRAYFIDVTEPGLATFAGSTHPVGTARCERTITVSWSAATDAHSGVEGYGLFWTTSPTSAPADVLDTTGTSDTVTLAPGTYYLNMKTVDEAGNWTSTYSSFGPFIISDECGTNYCTANPSSTGAPARIRALGSDTAAANDLTIEAYDMPLNTFGLLATSLAPGFVANPGGSQGNLCLGGSLGRYNANIMNSGATGSFQIPLDLTMTPTSVGMASVAAGETRYWQVWCGGRPRRPTSRTASASRSIDPVSGARRRAATPTVRGPALPSGTAGPLTREGPREGASPAAKKALMMGAWQAGQPGARCAWRSSRDPSRGRVRDLVTPTLAACGRDCSPST